MSQLNKSPNSVKDERLADFTDQVLAGRVDRVEPDADAELLVLEETVLRLKKTIPPATLDQAAVKKMQVRFKARVKRETREAGQPFWKKWFEPQPRLQFAAAFAVAALALIVVVLNPGAPAGQPVSAAAQRSVINGVFAAVTLAVILFVFWIKRRK